jgi:hypothetical protein
VRTPERLGRDAYGRVTAGGGVRQTAYVLSVLVVLGLSLVLASAADASTPLFTWTGASSESGWSTMNNWEGGTAPSVSEQVRLEFPHLDGCNTCYEAENNLSGLTAESLSIDNSAKYVLSGDELTLGAGGLTASPASSGSSGDVLKLPIKLGASQTWSIAGRNGGGLGENGAAVLGSLTGSSSTLNFEISNEAVLYLENETEVGPATISGADAGEAGIFNGFVGYFGELNFVDGNPVSLNHIFFVGSGALGALSTNQAELDIGSGLEPAEGIVADSATFDSGSEVGFQITGEGTTAGRDYSQLASTGSIELGGSTLVVHGTPPSSSSKVCPSPHPGQKYTFISTTGSLSGTFANAPEDGSEISIKFAKECNHPSQTMEIAYNRSGDTETVTGTVEEARVNQEAKEKREAEEKQEKEVGEREVREKQEAKEHQEVKKHQEEAKEKQKANEGQQIIEAEITKSQETAIATSRQHQEEEAAINHKHEEEAAARKKEGEEVAAKDGVLDAKTGSKVTAPTRVQLLAKALKQCKKQPKKKRAQCEVVAKKRYEAKAKGKKGNKK